MHTNRICRSIRKIAVNFVVFKKNSPKVLLTFILEVKLDESVKAQRATENMSLKKKMTKNIKDV